VATYLVTGGCGFIGSHLCSALRSAGHGVRVLDDLSTGTEANLAPGANFVRGDVADAGAVREAMEGAAGCFHLAAIASVERGTRDWLGTHRANLSGTVAVFEAAARLGRIPVVYASSAAASCTEPPLWACASSTFSAPGRTLSPLIRGSSRSSATVSRGASR
jgi:UDP-glucose 4-epimerase